VHSREYKQRNSPRRPFLLGSTQSRWSRRGEIHHLYKMLDADLLIHEKEWQKTSGICPSESSSTAISLCRNKLEECDESFHDFVYCYFAFAYSLGSIRAEQFAGS